MLEIIGQYHMENNVALEDKEWKIFKKGPIYEVLRVMDGVPLFWEHHFSRMLNSFERSGIPKGSDLSHLKSTVYKLLEMNTLKFCNIRIEVGWTASGWVEMIYCLKGKYPAEEVYLQGVPLVSECIVREQPQAKIFKKDYAEKVQAKLLESGAYEVLLLKDNRITEGSRSNILFVKGSTIYSPKSEDILLGISRTIALECLREAPLAYVEKDITLAELDEFEACFLTGTSIHILPISAIDHRIYQSAQNPTVQKLQNLFEKKVEKEIIKKSVDN